MDIKPQALIDQLDKLAIIINSIKILNEEKKISAANIGRLKNSGDDFSLILDDQKFINK